MWTIMLLWCNWVAIMMSCFSILLVWILNAFWSKLCCQPGLFGIAVHYHWIHLSLLQHIDCRQKWTLMHFWLLSSLVVHTTAFVPGQCGRKLLHISSTHLCCDVYHHQQLKLVKHYGNDIWLNTLYLTSLPHKDDVSILILIKKQ